MTRARGPAAVTLDAMTSCPGPAATGVLGPISRTPLVESTRVERGLPVPVLGKCEHAATSTVRSSPSWPSPGIDTSPATGWSPMRAGRSLLAALLLLSLAGAPGAQEIDGTEKSRIVKPFQVRLREFARSSRELALRVDRRWRESNILIVAIDRGGDACYRGGIESENIVGYESVTEGVARVLDGLDRLPPNIVRCLSGSGFYLNVEPSERRQPPVLILAPFRYNSASGNSVYRNMRYGLILEEPLEEGEFLRGLGMVLDTQVVGTYWDSRHSRNRFPRLRDAFGAHRAHFVTRMHSADEALGFISPVAKLDSFWDVGEHFRAYVVERARFECAAGDDPFLAFKFAYYESLFAFDPTGRRPPNLPDLDETEDGRSIATPVAEERILALWRTRLDAYGKKNATVAARVRLLLEERDILILPVSRNSCDLYNYGLRLEDIEDFASVEPGVLAVLDSLSRIGDRVLAFLGETGIYVSTRSGRSYAILSPFERNRGGSPGEAFPLRNLRRGYIFEKVAGGYDVGVATHEAGHVLDGRVRGLYTTEAFCAGLRKELGPRREAWAESLAGSGPEDFLTPYARSNASEDVAECFRMFVHDPETFLARARGNRRLLEKYAFMRDLFAGGR